MVILMEMPPLGISNVQTQFVPFKNATEKTLKETLFSFYCNPIHHNFVLNMFSIGQICKETFYPFCGVMDDVTKSLDVCHR